MKKTKKREKLEFVTDQEIYHMTMDIYGYFTSSKRTRKAYKPAEIEKKVDKINRFI